MGNELFSSAVDNIIAFLPEFTVNTWSDEGILREGEAFRDQSKFKVMICKQVTVICFQIRIVAMIPRVCWLEIKTKLN